jgi:hypothetical protein
MCVYFVRKVKDCDFIFKRKLHSFTEQYKPKVGIVLIQAYMKSYWSLKVFIYTVAACTDQIIVKI